MRALHSIGASGPGWLTHDCGFCSMLRQVWFTYFLLVFLFFESPVIWVLGEMLHKRFGIAIGEVEFVDARPFFRVFSGVCWCFEDFSKDEPPFLFLGRQFHLPAGLQQKPGRISDDPKRTFYTNRLSPLR